MPHIIVKLWPGKSEQQKQRLADAITQQVTTLLGYTDDAVSVGFDEVASSDWRDQVYRPDIQDKAKRTSLIVASGVDFARKTAA